MPETLEGTYSTEELQEMIRQMKQASALFYKQAIHIGNHAFIEFTGLINEYINLCEEALEQGIDFTTCNVHLGRALPVADRHAAYLGEKLGCIYGTALNPQHVRILTSQLGGGKRQS